MGLTQGMKVHRMDMTLCCIQERIKQKRYFLFRTRDGGGTRKIEMAVDYETTQITVILMPIIGINLIQKGYNQSLHLRVMN